MNGTLRDDENQACQNCGQIGHRKYDCPEKQNFTASIICRVCGNAGHMARDCPDRQRGASWRNDGPRPAGRIGGGGGGEDDAEYEVSHCPDTFESINTRATDVDNVTSNSWLSSAAEQRPPASRPDLAPTATATPNHGNVDLQVDLPLGAPATTTATTTMVGVVEAEAEEARVVLRRGLETDVSGTMTTMVVIATTAAVRTMATARLRPARRLGNKLPVPKAGMVALLHPAQRRGSRLLAHHPLMAGILAAMARLQVLGHRPHRLHRPLITSRP